MSIEDYFDPYDYEDPEDRSGATCKRCHTTGMEWIHNGVRWILVDARGPHQCPAATADDFED